MSTGYETSIELDLKPGATLWTVWSVFHMLGLAASFTLPPVVAAAAIALVLASALARLRRWQTGWRRLRWNGWGGVQVVGADGRTSFAQLGTEHFVTCHMVVLSVKKENRTIRFPIFGWEQHEAVRRLNQRLKAGHQPAPLLPETGDAEGV